MPLGIPGLEFLDEIDVGQALGGVGQFITIVLIFLMVGSLVAIYLWRKRQIKLFNKHIVWYEEVSGYMVNVGEDYARELTIPNTNVTVFYVRGKDMFMPRGTIRMGKNEYWYAIKNNREVVNFRITNINRKESEAQLDYDHTDMRYAHTNLRELIKRNYLDKSQPWWKVYQGVITLVVYIFVLSIAFFFLADKMGKLIDKAGSLMQLGIEACKNVGSGVIQN